MPNGFERCTVTFTAVQPRFFIDRYVVKPCIVNLDYLVSRLTLVDENAFQRTNQSNIANRKAQLFLHFSGDGIDTPFAKLNTSANRAKKSLLSSGVIELVDQYFSLIMKNTKSKSANAWL